MPGVGFPALRLHGRVWFPFVSEIYGSRRYSLTLNQSPSIIGADVFSAATNARGDGVKIAVVDDGVDQTNLFFNPAGYSYPAGFPKGQQQFTSPKVIAARSFPGPGSGQAGRLPVDRRASFHGTHVAGISAGNAGTNAPAGPDHPATPGLSGVAPRAWIGNYRVFNAPTPIGNNAFTPEIVEAFETAVADGMDVINFSGGAPAYEPTQDAMFETIKNVTAAGVVVVASAGNDRDEFGLGSVGSPSTAPDAISVAAVSNTQFFGQALTVLAPAAPGLTQIPLTGSLTATPAGWAATTLTLTDVGTLVRNGRPVDAHLCSLGADPNGRRSPLSGRPLAGQIALVSRGTCAFVVKAEFARAAGAIGIVFVNNRPGEPSFVPVELPIPGGMISDLDGARLREVMKATGGRAQVRIARDPVRLLTGRAGIPMFFSSAGPTAFNHQLKPDIAAPGGHILSSTLPEFAGSPFAVFDGTSMSAPHVAGAAALLVQRHPGWTPKQVKSALMSTAGPTWADTPRTAEAPVLLEGAGLANIPRADDPKIFTDPQSFSFGDLDVTRAAASRSLTVTVSDAGGGAGTWTIEVRPQAASTGAGIAVPPAVTLGPGSFAPLAIVARAEANAQEGENFGFIVLRRGSDERRIPYFFLATRSQLAAAPAARLRPFQSGTTKTGANRVTAYKYPSAPLGPAPNFIGQPMREDGAEKVFFTDVNTTAANVGVAVWAQSAGSLIDPYFLDSLDENDVTGYAGTPVNINPLMFDYRIDVGAAGMQFPLKKRYWVAVDSLRDRFTGKAQNGAFLLRYWINDVRPPAIQLLTTRVAAGRPLMAARVLDAGSGVDPFSLVIAYRRVLLAAALYDPASGLALFPLPAQAPAFPVGRTETILVGSDFQETKNIEPPGENIMPNTAFRRAVVTTVRGPAVTWLLPNANTCLAAREPLLVAASSTAKITAVHFLDARKRIGTDRRGAVGLYAMAWRTAKAAAGKHVLRALVVDAAGKSALATRTVRICRKK